MKRLIIIFSLIVGISAFQDAAQAQKISVNINIGNQPSWGPVGYDYVDYYYFPDIDCYYGINTGLFHFRERGHWIASRYLPVAYGHYDLYHLYKVVLNVNEPWRYHQHHYRDYARYRGYHNQIVIRDSHDRRYYKSRNNNIVWYNNKHSDKHFNKNFDKNFNKNHKPGKWQNDNRNGQKNRNSSYNKNKSKKDYNKKEYNMRSSSSSDRDTRQSARISSSGRSGDSNKSSRSGNSRSSSQTRSSDRSSRSM